MSTQQPESGPKAAKITLKTSSDGNDPNVNIPPLINLEILWGGGLGVVSDHMTSSDTVVLKDSTGQTPDYQIFPLTNSTHQELGGGADAILYIILPNTLHLHQPIPSTGAFDTLEVTPSRGGNPTNYDIEFYQETIYLNHVEEVKILNNLAHTTDFWIQTLGQDDDPITTLRLNRGDVGGLSLDGYEDNKLIFPFANVFYSENDKEELLALQPVVVSLNSGKAAVYNLSWFFQPLGTVDVL